MTQPTAAVAFLTWMDTYGQPPPIQVPVDAAANAGGGIIYGGSFVGENASTGYARRYAQGDNFLGVNTSTADNSGVGTPLGISSNIGDGTAGSITTPVQAEGYFFWSGTITGLAGSVADRGTVIYCSDGQSLTTTSASNAQVGTIESYENGKWLIKLVAKFERLANQN